MTWNKPQILTQIFQIFLIACINCKSFLPHIASPTCIRARSKTLIDNIFFKAYKSTFKSGNLLTTLCNNNVQYLFLENQIKINKSTETQYYQDFTAMGKKKINEQLQNINWAAKLTLDKNNVNLSTDLLLKKWKH